MRRNTYAELRVRVHAINQHPQKGAAMKTLFLLVVFAVSAIAARADCGIVPLTPIPPLGCNKLEPQCQCDHNGNCQWVFVCVDPAAATWSPQPPSLGLPRLLPAAMVQSASPQWQRATMIVFRTVAVGSSCASTSSSIGCSDTTETQYTLRVGQNTFVVEPVVSGARKAAEFAFLTGTAGFGVLFLREHVSLRNCLPGTSAFIRQHGNYVEIAVGKRHSLYSILAAK